MTALAAATVAGDGLAAIAGERVLCDRSGALWLTERRLLCVSDLHLEKGSAFARRGALIPPYDTAATLLRLQDVIAQYEPRIVVSLGDSFHDGWGAGRLPAAFREKLEALMAGRDWLWIAGNHDPDAPSGLPGETVKELAVGPLRFRHEPALQDAEGEIAGHLHPCARIVRRGRSVRRRCFAGDGVRMILPAFGAYTGSLNVLDSAYRGLFRTEALVAYMLGADRVFALPGSMLRPG